MSKPTFYVTTPIYYPSATLHIGHCYTTVAADTITRYKKMRGYDAYFLTGSDEHGQKIERAAAKAGMEPIKYVDGIIASFQELWKKFDIDYDDFIRTTQPRHEDVVREVFNKLKEKGDIYLGSYEGHYCVSCETFYTETQIKEAEGVCPDCGGPVDIVKEESYFFKLSNYADRLLEYIDANPDFIQPVSRRNEMINFIKQGLEDLSVSRTTFSWGIPVPNDPKHVVYVWLDALTNYISALGYTKGDERFEKYWPADVHLVGKDIVRFHTIIWPIMLMALDLPLPKKVFAHGWILVNEGKMSKSKGNVVDPMVLADKYSTDALRYFLLREFIFGTDGNYSEDVLINRINVDLANDFGNLLSRTTAMITKFQDGVIAAPTVKTEFDDELLELFKTVPEEMAEYMEKLEFHNAFASVWKIITKANKYIDECAPWALNKNGEKEKLATVLYNMAEAIRIATILLTPVMPNTPAKVFAQLGIAEQTELQDWDALAYGGIKAGTVINRGEPIFPRLELEKEEAPKQEKKEKKVKEKQQKKEDKAEVKVEKKAEEVEGVITIDDFTKVELRVGTILTAEKVENADKLLKFTVKIDEEERTIVSGIAKYYAPETLIGKNVVVVANLKPAKLRGIESKGMLLCASKGDELELLTVDIPCGGVVR
ncbi:MAG: methionine--tRNA ligase [Firmicutes bacterium]|nr:methionine--tRNA ligase [Bacillota bacterium]